MVHMKKIISSEKDKEKFKKMLDNCLKTIHELPEEEQIPATIMLLRDIALFVGRDPYRAIAIIDMAKHAWHHVVFMTSEEGLEKEREGLEKMFKELSVQEGTGG